SLIVLISVIFVVTIYLPRDKFTHLVFYFRGPAYLIVAAKAFIYYLKILYMPIARGLYHPFALNTTEIQSISPALFASLAILSVLVFVSFKFRHSEKPISFGIMWFLVTYSLYSNVIPVCNIISERYLYLPSIGFSIFIAALFLVVWDKVNKNIQYRKALRGASLVAITLFLSSYATLTIKRNFEYRNMITYWESNINNFPDGNIFYNNLAGTYYRMGSLGNAISYCWINLLIKPDQPHVWYNLGMVYGEIGDIERAALCYKEVLRYDTSYLPAIKALEKIEEGLNKETAI
ncbi:hypothetical protein ACFL96_17910, partial [Thermoproteota archaeon]